MITEMLLAVLWLHGEISRRIYECLVRGRSDSEFDRITYDLLRVSEPTKKHAW